MTLIKQRFFLIVFLLSAHAVSAQQPIKIQGKVFDEAQQPLAGAMIVNADTDQGVSSDSKGYFEINCSPGGTLTVSFMGRETQNVAIGSRTNIEVVLSSQVQEMDDVVVVGYGTQKRVNVTGAVSSVNYAKEAASRPVTSTAQILSGMSAGLMVTQPTGQPGQEGVMMRIRGIGTLNTSAPLVLVDGFETGIANVNPDDIESVSILKDAASCAIYGNRGANGVVLVTTKSGKSGHSVVSFSSILSFNRPQNKIDIISNYADYMELMNESAENIGNVALPFSQAMIDLWREKSKDPNGIAESGYPNYVAYPNVDWMDAVFQNEVYQKYNLSASGSKGGISYLTSLTYMNNPGVIMKSGYEQISLRANVSSQVNKWLEIGTRLYGYESGRELNDLSGAFSYMSRAVPCIYPYYDGKYGWMENPEQSTNSRNNLYFTDRVEGKEKIHYYNATLFANVRLPYSITNSTSFNYIRNTNEYKYNTRTLDAFSFRTGETAYQYQDLSKMLIRVRNTNAYRWTFANTLSWNQTFKKHDISALAGFEAMYYNTNNANVEKNSFLNDRLVELDTVTNMVSITGTQADYASASVFGRVNYAYDNRYLLEANLRYDGSSRFARESRWGLFPSVSAGWRISEEAFMEDTAINNLKLRGSWGKLGNNSIGNYEYQATYATGSEYSFGGKQVSGLVSTLSNNLLEWETTTTTDVGIELSVLRNRLTFEADYYNRVTSGILYNPSIYGTAGVKSPPQQNIAEVVNNGMEFTVGWRDRARGFNYGVSANFTRNYNVVSKYEGPLRAGWVTDANGFRSYQTNLGDVSTANGTVRRIVEGKMINEFYLLNTYSGDGSHFFADGSVNPNGGPRDGMIRTEGDMAWLRAMAAEGNTFLPNKTVAKSGIWYGDLIYADTNGDGVFGDDNDYMFQNTSMTPKYYYGFQVNMSWKGIDFSMNWAGAGGYSLYWRHGGFNSYSTRADLSIGKSIAYDHYFYDPENPTDPRTNITSRHGRLTMNFGTEQNGGTNYSTHWLYKGDFLKLRNVTLGYTLPAKWLRKVGLQDVRIFVSGDNLLTFTEYPGMDPEFNDSMNFYANMKQYSVGLNLKF